MKEKQSNFGAQTVIRASAILKFIARFPRAGVRLLDISRNLEISRPTVHRILQALVSEGFVRQNADRRYVIGSLMFGLTLMSGGFIDLVKYCRPALKKLAEQTGDTSFLFVRYGDDALCLAREQGSFYIQTPVVSENSLHPLGVSAGGLAILGALSKKEAMQVLDSVKYRLAPPVEQTKENLIIAYEAMQETGYALIGDLAIQSVKGVGVPIYSDVGDPVAAVTTASTHARMTDDRVRKTIPFLLEASKELSQFICLKNEIAIK